jgi:hypothetical protein
MTGLGVVEFGAFGRQGLQQFDAGDFEVLLA